MLTVDDLHATLEDERHLGFGYACTRDAPASVQARLDRAVVHAANALGLDAETLFHWSNSKWGRWLADGVIGRDEPPTRATAGNYLNERAVAEAIDGVELRPPLSALHNYVANVLGEGLIDSDMPVESNYAPVRPDPDEPVLVLYGDREAATVLVAAVDENDAERLIIRTFGLDACIDGIDLSTDQRPLAVNLTAGRVANEDVAWELLRLDAENGGTK